MTKDKGRWKIYDGGSRGWRDKEGELDIWGGIREGRKRNLREEENCWKFWVGLLVDWCCWDFGLGGQEI
jgi:hypothetical protein